MQNSGVSFDSLLIVTLLSIEKDSDELKDALRIGAFGKSLHGWLDQVEPLLEVVEANHLVEFVPVQLPHLRQGIGLQLAVDFLVIDQVEKALE